MLPGDWTNLIALLDGRPDADPMTRVTRLCEVCVQAVAVTGASLSITSNGNRSTVCASDELAEGLEDLQDTFSEGPSVEAARHGWAVQVPDLAADTEQRWPWFRSAAVEVGAKAMFALPLRAAAMRLGALSMYRDVPGGLTPGEVKDARTLAEAASILLTLNQPGEHTAQAFMWVVGDSSRFRPEVHQAVGATMVHLGLNARDAYARICAHAFAQGRPIGEVARDIMAKRLRLAPD